jgi:hypothetical protein
VTGRTAKRKATTPGEERNRDSDHPERDDGSPTNGSSSRGNCCRRRSLASLCEEGGEEGTRSPGWLWGRRDSGHWIRTNTDCRPRRGLRGRRRGGERGWGVWSIRHVHICDLMGHRKRERRRKRRRICHVRICDLMGHDRGGV